MVSSTLGQRDQTIRYLQEALDQRAPSLVLLNEIAAFDPLHSDPRYRAIVKRIGLPPDPVATASTTQLESR